MIDEGLKESIHSLAAMSPDDWRQVLQVLTSKEREQSELQPSTLSALNIRITYDLVQSLHKMDKTSAALTRKLVVLTWLLVVFTVVLLIEPVAAHFLHW
jgi:hypothetical protein